MFGLKKPQKNEKTQKDARQESLAAFWELYWQKKEEIDKLKEQLKGTEDAIKRLMQHDFKGQTAKFGTNKLSYTDRPKVIKPKSFDFAGFVEEYPQLCRTDIDEAKIAKAIADADSRFGLEQYGLDVEYVRSYTFKKG